jgi:hypothetical protein
MKMSVNKKLLSIVLSLVMVLVALPLADFSSFATDPADFDYIVVSDEDMTAEITGYNGDDADVVIPSEIDGYTIIYIDMLAFINGGSIERITIPSTIEDFSYYALASLSSCEEFIVEAGNNYYSSMDGVLFNTDKTTIVKYPNAKPGNKYTIPATVEDIAPFAFAMCTQLERITLDDEACTIGMYAFAYCVSLESIYITPGVSYFDSSAFKGCSSLTNITLPEGLFEIYMETFDECGSLTEIYLPSTLSYCEDNPFDGSALETIYGTPGTFAEQFADDYGYTFVDVTPYLIPGDMNGDGAVNGNDVDVMMEIAAGIDIPSYLQILNGDADGDYNIDGFDAADFDRKIYANID